MEHLRVVIEKAEDNYSAYIKEIDGIAVSGKTISEIKECIADAIDIYVDTCRDMGVYSSVATDRRIRLVF